MTAQPEPTPAPPALLAIHARELAALIGNAARTDPECAHPSNARAAARRGGMIAARLILARYADTLDAAAVDGGEQQ